MSDSESEKDADDGDGGLLNGMITEAVEINKKRSREELDVSAEEMAAKNHKAGHNRQRKIDKIAPIIIFKVESNLLIKENLEKYLNDFAHDLNLKDVKITTNGNVLIYADNLSDKQIILNNKDLFKNCKKLDLNSVDKRPCLIIKGISKKYADEHIDDLKQVYGIIEVFEMKNKTSGKVYNFVKAVVESEERKRSILLDRFVHIGYFRYFTDDFKKPPIQCRKCKGFGHIEAKCTYDSKCAKCGINHDETKCSSDITTCANCGGGHSCFYRGCSAYKEKRSEQLKKINVVHAESSTKNSNSSTFERNYSSAVKNNISKCIEDKITNLSTQIENSISSIKEVKSSLDKINQNLIDLKQSLINNNLKTIYFIIDLFKIMNNNVKINAEKAKQIFEAFSYHDLGELNLNKFKDYCEKKVDFTKVNQIDYNLLQS